MPDGGFAAQRLIVLPGPFSTERIESVVMPGMTIQQIVDCNLPELSDYLGVHVWVSDPEMKASTTYIPREYWGRVRPINGAVVTLRVVPLGGGGGGGGKNPMRTILSIAVVVAAAAVTWGVSSALGAGVVGKAGAASTWAATSSGLTFAGTLAAGAAGAAVGFVGNLLVNAIAPPPTLSLPQFNNTFNGQSTAPTLSITGIQNRSNQYGPIPRVFGRVRMFPPLAAVPYTEVSGDDQYLRMLFCFGYGPLEISDLKIGTIPLSQFDGVETELRQGYSNDTPITLYSNTVNEDSYSIRLLSGQARTVVTRTQAEEFVVDITFDGLVYFDDNGNRQNNSVDIKTEYRKVGDASWIDNGTTTFTAATEQVYRRSIRKANLPSGQYEVRLTRITSDQTSSRYRSACSVTTLRSITYSPPNTQPGLCLLALRIKATNQLNGIVQELSGVAQALFPIYDANTQTWSAPTATRNPAWAVAEVFRGSANAKPFSDARLDLDSFVEFAEHCDELDQNGEPKFRFDAAIDTRTTVDKMVRTILATARANYTPNSNGKYRIVIDKAGKIPAQLFTPRNSWGFKGKKIFVPPVHALRARYIEPDREWQQHEIIAYADGYSASNATEFEVIEFFGVTRSSQAWRDARYQIAQGKLRPETYELYADMEHIVCRKGDLVRVAHDIPRWGLGQGRVKSLIMDGSDVAGVIIDAPVAMEADKTYALRFRLKDNTQIDIRVVGGLTSNAVTSLTFIEPKDPSEAPEVGDLFAFGELNRTAVNLIVKNIYSSGELNARIELVDESPAIFTSDTGSIPEFDTQSTWPASGLLFEIQKPVVLEIRSDEEAMFRTANGFVPAIRLTFAPRSGPTNAGDYIEAQIRRTGSDSAWRPFSPFFGSPSTIFLTPIDDGAQYDLRVRYVTPTGKASQWTNFDAYIAEGRIALPPDVASLSIHGENLVWSYANPPNDLAGFNVLWNYGTSANVATAQLAHPLGSTVNSPFPISAFPPGPITILVFAVDSAGNTSANPGVIYRQVADPTITNIIEEIDLQALGFPGTRPDTSIISGDLYADESSEFWSNDPTTFWPVSNSAIFWPTTTYFDMVYDFSVVPPIEWVPVSAILQASILADSYTIMYRQGGTGPAWSGDGEKYWGDDPTELFWPDAGEYLPWPGAISVGREKIDFRISGFSGSENTQTIIDQLKVLFDVPDIEEVLLDVTLSAGGSRLSPVKTYRVIKTINIDIVENGSGAFSAKIMDRLNTGPLVQTFNTAGTGVAGKINATIKGY